MAEVLGTRKAIFGFACLGCVPADQAELLALRLVAFAGMNPARKGRLDEYPFNGGGGLGYTFYQPLMESFLVIDVYPAVNQTKVTLATCKPERLHAVAFAGMLAKELGGPILRQGYFEL